MLPKSLTEIINSVDYTDYDFRFRNIDLTKEFLEVEFSINDTEGSDEKVILLMTISGTTDFFIEKNDNSAYIQLESENPLLWRFSDIQCELYITGQTKASKELVFDLLSIHHSLFGRYISFDPNIFRTLNNGYGLFQKGSKKLLKLYADKLHEYEYGIEASIMSELPVEKQYLDLKILFLGSSYFIGNNYDFRVRD